MYAEITRLYNPSESEDKELEIKINESVVLLRAVVELERLESSRLQSLVKVSGSGRSVNETRGQLLYCEDLVCALNYSEY